MKNALALAVSLLMPVVPVLADVAPDQTSQAAAISAQQTANAGQMAQALQSGTRSDVAAPPPAASSTPPTPPSAPPSVASHRSDLGNVADAPPTQEKKQSFFSKMKDKVVGFVTKHPILVGAFIGGLIGLILGGPAGLVIGVSLGAVAGDATAHVIAKFKKKGD